MQSKKSGMSANSIITVRGKSLTVREWTRVDPSMGLTVRLILERIRLGWTPRDAVTTPTRKKQYRKEPTVVDTEDKYDEEEVWVFEYRTSRAGEYVKKIIRKPKEKGNDNKEGVRDSD